jgi:hypothetical protein
LEEWNSTDIYIPRTPRGTSYRIALKNRDRFKPSYKRWIAAVTLTIIIYYLITNIR